MQAEQLNKNVERLSSTADADAATSFRVQMDSYVNQYIKGEEVETRVEVPTCAGPQPATPAATPAASGPPQQL